ncbi:chloramphenicol phosphotransferase CPT family protein [Paenibacillus pasadenensis]|uniref:chloramphenicol phosphotransferase CPT family protein n=1 Tax=Paenibacillus pasadenensis TaxID=217090 RepID=UPI00203BB673|nr:AAA family ATPase [Paenibacillus pasadenensis]MCM3748888.1 chloramphenicol phosphotransferase CPT family protein [Paenibacillus pasadenensis]
MKKGLVIFLNGTSSSGKTSISTELLNQNEFSFHHLSIDDFFLRLFNHYIDFINTTCSNAASASGEDVQVPNDIIINPLAALFYSTIKFMSAKGMNIVVDTVNDTDERLNSFLSLLMDHPVLVVGVTCSKEELIKRERARGDREIGLAISQYDKVYSLNEYDIELNTETLRPAECANLILNFVRSNQEYSAFKKLHKRSVGVS